MEETQASSSEHEGDSSYSTSVSLGIGRIIILIGIIGLLSPLFIQSLSSLKWLPLVSSNPNYITLISIAILLGIVIQLLTDVLDNN